MNATMLRHVIPCFLAAAAAVPATAQTVDYPSSVLASPPQISFPFYTPGAATGATVRTQWLCPDTFLAAQNLAPGLVTHIGLSLAGQAVHDVFVLRAGVAGAAVLGGDWTVNLPDQRIQRDLSHALVVGGGTQANPTNQWVEFDLDHPFHWQPGQSIVVDLTVRLATPGVHLQTTTGVGVARAYNFSYTAGAPAAQFSGSGCAFRMVFATTDVVTFGAGCAGSGGVVPSLSSLGSASLGNTMAVFANRTLQNTFAGFLFGFSRRESSSGPLPQQLGGGCSLLVAPDAFAPVPILPVGSGLGQAGFSLNVPADPMLAGLVLYTQFAQFDASSPASVPATFSNGGIIVVH